MRTGSGVRRGRRATRCARWTSAGGSADARAARRPVDLRDRRQPVLQPACPAAGDVPAARRLRAAGGSAARRGAADSGDRAPEARLPADWSSSDRRTAICRNGCRMWRSARARGAVRSRRPRRDRALVSGSAGRRAARRAARAQRRSAGRSATARPARGWASCPGCYPLDPFYAARPEAVQIRDVRTQSRA